MTTRRENPKIELWRSIAAQASLWSTIDLFKQFSQELPRNASEVVLSSTAGVLQDIEASSSQIVSSRPLLMGNLAPFFAEMPGLPGGHPISALSGWLPVAQRVEMAHRRTLAWLRSRLPGYPSIPAPHLVQGTQYTTREFTWKLIWTPDERAQGLQFKGEPPTVAGLLGANTRERALLARTAQEVARCLEATEEWINYEAASKSLTATARSELREVNAELAKRLSPEEIVARADNLMLDRDWHRGAVLSEALSSLSGPASEFSLAFDSINSLMEFSAGLTFGQLAAYGEPEVIQSATNIDFMPGVPPSVSFDFADDAWPVVGRLVWLNDPLTPDAIFVTGVSLNINNVTGSRESLTGKILDGTADGWARDLRS